MPEEDATGEWVKRSPFDPPIVDSVCIEAVRMEGVAGAESGFDMMEFMFVDHTTDPDGKPIAHVCRFSVGMAMALSYSIKAWMEEEPPDWQEGHRHIHVEIAAETPNHEEGVAQAYWVERGEDHGR